MCFRARNIRLRIFLAEGMLFFIYALLILHTHNTRRPRSASRPVFFVGSSYKHTTHANIIQCKINLCFINFEFPKSFNRKLIFFYLQKQKRRPLEKCDLFGEHIKPPGKSPEKGEQIFSKIVSVAASGWFSTVFECHKFLRNVCNVFLIPCK